jgi:hypothetical protein
MLVAWTLSARGTTGVDLLTGGRKLRSRVPSSFCNVDETLLKQLIDAQVLVVLNCSANVFGGVSR